LDKCLEKSREILEKFEETVDGSQSVYMKVLAELGMGSGANMNQNEEDADDNSKGDLEDYDTAEEEDGDNEEESEHLGSWFICCWERQCEKLVHDFSVSAWLVSPIPEIYNDAKENQYGNLHHTQIE